MKDLSLKQLEGFGVNNFMSDKEIERTILRALQEQQEALNTQSTETPKEVSLEDVLRDGGLFTYVLNNKKYKLNVLTKDDMNILDNSSNYLEDGVEYDIVKPYRYHCKNSHDNYVTVKVAPYDEAKKVIDSIYGGGLYSVSASSLWYKEIEMRTYNQQNTQNVKQARKQSKELRKLKIGRNAISVIEPDEFMKGLQNTHYYEDDYNAYEGGEC